MTERDDTKLSGLHLASSLPSLPTAALEVLRVCDDADAEIADLAAIIGRDPMLASRVLQVANSAFYNRGHEVTTLQRATMLLGMRALKVVSLGFTLTHGLPQHGSPAGLDLGVYWHRSVVNAVIARSLAQSIDRALAEEAFLCGLLSEIGKLALSQAIPDRYATAVAAGHGWPDAAIEKASLGFSASEAAEILLRAWSVPELIVLGASFADRSTRLPAETADVVRELAAIIGLAQLGTAIVLGAESGETLSRFADVGRRLGLSPLDVDALVTRLPDDVAETAGVLSVELPPGVSTERLLEQARLLMVSFSVDAVIQLEQRARTIESLARENAELEQRARTDALTGLPNRGSLDAFLHQQVAQRLRDELPGLLGVVMIDLDGFHGFNDRYGHPAGDAVLRSIGRALQQATRDSDVLARYGGEEFCLVVPNTTPEDLLHAAERLRELIEEHPIDLGLQGSARITASFGVANLERVTGPDDGARLVADADAALYRAKDAGRNRVEVATWSRTGTHLPA